MKYILNIFLITTTAYIIQADIIVVFIASFDSDFKCIYHTNHIFWSILSQRYFHVSFITEINQSHELIIANRNNYSEWSLGISHDRVSIDTNDTQFVFMSTQLSHVARMIPRWLRVSNSIIRHRTSAPNDDNYFVVLSLSLFIKYIIK